MCKLDLTLRHIKAYWDICIDQKFVSTLCGLATAQIVVVSKLVKIEVLVKSVRLDHL